MSGRRGVALLVVLGVLGVLTILGVAFVVMAQLERRASQQRLNSIRAMLLARSGLEDALARLSAGQDPSLPSSCYRGEDWNGDGSLDGLEVADEVYHPGILDTDACPPAHALRPSFYARDGFGMPVLVSVSGRRRGYSGKLAGQHAPEGSHYAVRCFSGGIYVNGGDLSVSGQGYNLVLRRILGTLAEAMDREDGAADGAPTGRAQGEWLVDARPRGGWTSLAAIRSEAIRQGVLATVEPLIPYLTTTAWVDRKVIRPNGTAALENLNPQTWADIRLGTQAGGAPTRTAPGFELAASGGVLGRAPVDLAWARHRKPVLIALMEGLKGLYLDETTCTGGQAGGPDNVGTLRSVEVELNWSLPSDSCRLAADRLLACTSDLSCWQDWDTFCDGIPFTGTSDQIQVRRDILKANFNPNSDLNKFNPDPSLARLSDKSDLLAYSTEFNLTPLGGQRVASVGRVLDASGRILAQRQLGVEIGGDSMVRLTTQSEFVAGDLGTLDVAGDETLWRQYGSPGYISESQGIDLTFGHRLNLGGYLNGNSRGVSLQTVPESHVVWTLPATGRPAVYDGQVRLATLETADGGDYQTPAVPGSLRFLARWGKGVDADVGGSTANASPADTDQPPDANSLWDPAAPGVLHTDGLYIEKGRQPGYLAQGNLSAYRGTLSFWCKPNYDGTKASAVPFVEKYGMIDTRSHLYFNNTRNDGTPSHSACFILVNDIEVPGKVSGHFQAPSTAGPRGLSFYTEPCFDMNDSSSGAEQIEGTGVRPYLPRRWYLLTCLWDMTQSDGSLAYKLLVDRGIGSGNVSQPAPQYCGPFPPPGTDFTQPDGATTTSDVASLSPAVFYLGRRGNLDTEQILAPDVRLPSYQSFGTPDATFDEFALYDFGPSTGTVGDAKERTEKLALNRFEQGRYYKESNYVGLELVGNTAGEFVSAPLDLGAVRLTRLAWTQVVPRGLRGPAGSPAEAGDPGPDGRVLLELLDAAGDAYLPDAVGAPVYTRFTFATGHPVDRAIRSPFRLHAVFQPNLDNALATPILDPLALDDITVAYRRQAFPPILSWEAP